MPVDAARVTALIDELQFKNPADKEYLVKVLTDPANEASATQFVGQRERHSDYTRRTQELATERQSLERKVNEQVQSYATQLAEADERLKKLADDLKNTRISQATYQAQIQRVKELYNLSDDDLPKADTPPNGGGKDGSSSGATADLDIKKILKDFKSELLNELMPELMAFPSVAAMQNEILAQHQELTGKRLTRTEMEDLMRMTQDPKELDSEGRRLNLMRAWEKKFAIGDIRKTKERESWSTEERRKWDDELKRKQSDEAMRTVRSSREGDFTSNSPVFREYQTHTESADRDFTPAARDGDHGGSRSQQPRTPDRPDGPKLSGAERAAQKFMERRNKGIPMGKEEPAGSRQ